MRSVPTPLSEILAYLSDIGYGDLYLRSPSRSPLGAAAQAPAPARAPELTVPPSPPPRELSPGAASRAAELESLAATVAGCTRCRLAEGRKSVVFGSGNPAADLMLIGEGPGAEEDRQGLPFVGRAGALLTELLEEIGMTRGQVWITNVLRCRPPGNRDPQPIEIESCQPYT
ncbi:MAG TPA: uracil-DNA glycosylase, partial [Thermoanaerobaculia bacterium]|nr:uracil-DNA glycosylase [Thermoanaerobaculia bacterium]